MHHNYPNDPRRSRKWDTAGDGNGGDVGPGRWSAERIARLMREHPEYRLKEDPITCQLIQMALADPDDVDVHGFLSERFREHQMAFLASGDAFFANYPNPGTLQQPSDFVEVGQMPTGDAIGLVISQLPGNLGLLGPTRSGKTTLLAHIFISNPHLLQTTCILAFVKKPELRHLVTVPQIGGMVLVFRKTDLAFSFFEPPGRTPEAAWKNEVVRLVAQGYARFSAQRLFGKIVDEVMSYRPDRSYPTLPQAVEVLDAFKPRWGSREAGYQESMSYVLNDLLNCTGRIWDYSSSTFLEVLTGTPGLKIIELEDLPQEHFTLIVTYVARWVYFRRLYGGEAVL